MRDAQLIRPAGQYSTIDEINEARANAFPIDYGRRDPYASAVLTPGEEVFDGEKSPEVYVDINTDGLTAVGTIEATQEATGLVDVNTATWDWGDATATTTGARSEHVYAAAGTYDVTVRLTDADGDEVLITDTLTVA